MRVKGVDVFRPQTGEIESGGTGCIAVKVINHLGDEVMKVFGVERSP